MIIKNNFIYVPNRIKIIIWSKNKNRQMILLNKNKQMKINTKNDTTIKICKWSNSIILNNKVINLSINKKLKKINLFIKVWEMFIYKKIKFKGKGFRIKFFKKVKIIKFYFGKSHKTFIFLNKIKKMKINKYKFLLLGINKNKIFNITNKIVNIKKINFYTLRGIRTSRQIVYKRKGKKGTYI